MKQIFSRMGDGSALWLSEDELRHELRSGSEDAADRGKIAPLSEGELERLYEICAEPRKVVSVEPGHEVVHSFDAGTLKFPLRGGVPVDRLATVMAHERAFCSDTFEVGHSDYSFKPVKAIISEERQSMEQIQLNATMPVYYGAMPNLGLYTKPDGPIDNWSELLPMGKVQEAREAQEEAVEMAVKDIYFVSEAMHQAGSDGINFDTVGASGDADFLASLKAVEKLKKAMPEMHIEMGMAGEFVLGMHGGLKYDDTRLAGLYCHKQLEVAEKAGVDIFGPVINTKSNKSVPWNIARACTFVKACSEISKIPIHPNAGMGVGGVPVTSTAPVDAISRASVALIEIGKADGLQIGHGDSFGMAFLHELATGMGGVRTAGDLVARVMAFKKLRVNEAKKYVADKLGISVFDLCDSQVMREVREDLNIGHVLARPGGAIGIEAKIRIAELLDIEINSVNRFKERAGFKF